MYQPQEPSNSDVMSKPTPTAPNEQASGTGIPNVLFAPQNYGPTAYPPPPQPAPMPYAGAPGMPYGAVPSYPMPPGPVPAQVTTVVAANYMPMVPPIAGCPSGLEYLTAVDQLLVQQKMDLLELITGFEANNKYELKNSVGQRVYFAAEQTDYCTRQCCGPIRPFTIKIADNSSRVVMEAKRPLRCQSCCCPCCLQQLEVFAPEGTLIGIVEQSWTLCKPWFTVYDANHEAVLEIRGPCVQCRCCDDVKFRVFSLNGGYEVGCISKQWSGILQESFSNADNFCVSFPMDLDVKMKATLVATAFLVDFMFFEEKKNDHHHHHHHHH